MPRQDPTASAGWAKYGSTFNVEQTDADFVAESIADLRRIIDGINAQEELSRTR